MDADGSRQNEEEREHHSTETIREQIAAGLTGQDRVPDRVRGEDPEIHEGMAEEPEQRSREQRIDGLHPA